MTTATLASTGYAVLLQNGRQEFAADEPLGLGGSDTGPSPDELLEASLASCTAITLRMYCNRKQWPVTGIVVTVRLERQTEKTIFTRSIHIDGAVDEIQRKRLLEIALQCPVSRTLHGVVEVNSGLS